MLFHDTDYSRIYESGSLFEFHSGLDSGLGGCGVVGADMHCYGVSVGPEGHVVADVVLPGVLGPAGLVHAENTTAGVAHTNFTHWEPQQTRSE